MSTRQSTLSTRIMLIVLDIPRLTDTPIIQNVSTPQRLALGVFQVIYGFIFRTQTLTAKQARVGFSINVDDITWDREGILRRWPGYVNFSKVIFGGC